MLEIHFFVEYHMQPKHLKAATGALSRVLQTLDLRNSMAMTDIAVLMVPRPAGVRTNIYTFL
jgi:hypothetical protein